MQYVPSRPIASGYNYRTNLKTKFESGLRNVISLAGDPGCFPLYDEAYPHIWTINVKLENPNIARPNYEKFLLPNGTGFQLLEQNLHQTRSSSSKSITGVTATHYVQLFSYSYNRSRQFMDLTSDYLTSPYFTNRFQDNEIQIAIWSTYAKSKL